MIFQWMRRLWMPRREIIGMPAIIGRAMMDEPKPEDFARAAQLMDAAEVPDGPRHVRCTVSFLRDECGIECGEHVKPGAVIQCDDGSTFTITGS